MTISLRKIVTTLVLATLYACSGGADGLVRLNAGGSQAGDAFSTGPEFGASLTDAGAQNPGNRINSGQDATRGPILNDVASASIEEATNHPCQPSFAPGSADQECTLLVCAKDDFCCDSYWDSVCTQYAVDLCEVACSCEQIDTSFLSCDSDEDCSFCGGNLCTGSWACMGGTCSPRADVICEPSSNNGCIQNICNPKTGQCSLETNHSACNDNNPCTKDTCLSSNGYCQYQEMELCMKNSPCKEAESPGSNNPTVSECVCAIHPDCCSDKWSWWCTYVAESDCEAQCDCAQMPSSDLACISDSDCSFCDPNADVCTGQWKCSNNQCVKEAGLTCDSSNDINCLVNTCDPTLGACTMKAQDTLCDDGLNCTNDFCTINVQSTGSADAACVYQAIENCSESNTSSCVDRCGTYEAGAACQCDENCSNFKDCCLDKCNICTSLPECQ